MKRFPQDKKSSKISLAKTSLSSHEKSNFLLVSSKNFSAAIFPHTFCLLARVSKVCSKLASSISIITIVVVISQLFPSQSQRMPANATTSLACRCELINEFFHRHSRRKACKTYLLLSIHLKSDADSVVCSAQRMKSFWVVHSWFRDTLAVILDRSESISSTFRLTFPVKFTFFACKFCFSIFFTLSSYFVQLNKEIGSFSHKSNEFFHFISLSHDSLTHADHLYQIFPLFGCAITTKIQILIAKKKSQKLNSSNRTVFLRISGCGSALERSFEFQMFVKFMWNYFVSREDLNFQVSEIRWIKMNLKLSFLISFSILFLHLLIYIIIMYVSCCYD